MPRRRAFEAGPRKKPRERAEILRKAFELIVRDAERFAKLITIENGKALSDQQGEVLYSAEFFRWNAEEAVRNIGQIYNAPASGARVVAQYRPAGVAVLVTPWNFPPRWRRARSARHWPPAARWCSSPRARRRSPCWR
jgi:succinate-semialdehyde dehydrogenase/glutarate-semialdehyde dehydrogenase